MTYRKNINIVNVAKEMAETFGYSNYFATLSLSLSLSLRRSSTITYILLSRADTCAEYTAFLANLQGRPHCLS